MSSIFEASRLFLLPEVGSEYGIHFDYSFGIVISILGGIGLITSIIIILFTLIYKNNKNYNVKEHVNHSLFLELTWSILPFIACMFLFFLGIKDFLNMYIPASNAKEIRLLGQKWQWSADYTKENINVSGQNSIIGLALNQPIKFILTSQDVIHSFFLPNFRVKQDVVPGKYTILNITPNKVGVFPVFCAEYCGDQHSKMIGYIKVMPKNEYNEWIDVKSNENQGLNLVELGEKLVSEKGCMVCHTSDGTALIGPSFKGTYQAKLQLSDGTFAVIDDDFIHEKLTSVQQRRIAGYPPVMPNFENQLNEKQISAIIEYIRSVQ